MQVRHYHSLLALLLGCTVLAGCGSSSTDSNSSASIVSDSSTSESSSSDASSSSDPEALTVYLNNTLGYSAPHVHYWESGVENSSWATEWPGSAMTLFEGQVYAYSFPSSVPADADIAIVFNDEGSAQTADAAFDAANNCYSNGSWMSLDECLEDTGTGALPTGKNRVFVHLFEWSWSDIAQECEQWLGPKGYDAVQVSPPQEHIQGPEWWTRYQPVDYNIDQSRSGTRAQFIDMVERCAAEDVDIYVDAVINHMAERGTADTGTAGTAYDPETLDYVGFAPEDFHEVCHIQGEDYANDANRVRTCRLNNLPDLDTGSENVRASLANYMNDLIGIGVKGFRIDAAKHTAVADIESILGRLHEEVYIFQEVIDNGSEAVSASDYTDLSDVTEFQYSGQIGRTFKERELSSLEAFGPAVGMMSGDHAVVFIDNHDNQRGHGGGGDVVTYQDDTLYDLANVFMLAWPYGHPKVMSSYEFTDTDAGPPSRPVHGGASPNCSEGDWVCEHRRRPIANMVAFRHQAESEPVTHWWAEGNQLAFGRGEQGFVIINRSDSQLTQSLETGMAPGEYCNVIDVDFDATNSSCNATIVVDESVQVSVDLDSMSAIAIHSGAKL
ncbi:starch-binding protein [Marinimicrobium sp. C2-29]|uniref:starch-binding protein n=1 Tax=Marinimicrobium sp. C2-29 TaxID=3139825 RepID=UPI00313A4566